MVIWWAWLVVALVIVFVALGAGVIARRRRGRVGGGPEFRAREVGGTASTTTQRASAPRR